MKTLTPSSALTAALDAEHVSYELIPHRRTQSAVAEARAIGLEPSHVAKTLVLVTGEGFVRAVLPASERIDLGKVREILSSGEVRLASEQTLIGAYPEFELGAVPPIGGAGDRVLVDRRVVAEPTVVFEAGTHEHSVRLKSADLVTVTSATVADICQD
jgi:Ala-tRNA(Pro) deacylase